MADAFDLYIAELQITKEALDKLRVTERVQVDIKSEFRPLEQVINDYGKHFLTLWKMIRERS